MKMKPITKRVPWTDEHDREVIALYQQFHAWQESGEPYQKAKHVRALAEKQGRSKGSIEMKLCNVSGVYVHVLNMPFVIGYAPLANFSKALAQKVCEMEGFEYDG